jgi:ribosomal protein S18 acetylase RimI-like enzyme
MAGANGRGGPGATHARQAPLIREAAPEDAGAIARVHVDSWRGAYRECLPADLLASLSVERRRAFWEGTLASSDASVLVADAGGEVVGFVSVGPSRSEEGNAELYAIYVEPERFGTGVGRALMDAAVERMRERGYREATLWVLDGNERAERFYRIAGWRREDAIQEEQWGSWTLREVRYRRAL